MQKWYSDRIFKNKEEVLKFVESENNWSYHYTNKTTEGNKRYYRCNKVKARGNQCDAKIHLLFDSTSDDVVLFRTHTAHTHQNLPTTSYGKLSTELKEEIKNLVDLKTKPKAIMLVLQDKYKKKVITKSKLKNFIAQYKKEKYGPTVISLGELEQWSIDSSAIPDQEDEAFVVNHKIVYEDDYDEEMDEEDEETESDDEDTDENSFYIFISTKRLLKLASNSTKIHADATYKLIWQGFPVLIVGTTDLDRHFHPFGLAICSNETTTAFTFIFQSLLIGLTKLESTSIEPLVLISDAANSIRSAFQK
jgi:hypothetical protein